MPAKGGQFERDICRKLSLWWTEGKRDDVFWRSASSGAMATSRMRTKGKTTYGQHGDIQAVDPIGAPLLKLCCFELKRGYGKWSPMDVLDAPPPRKGAKEPVKQAVTKFIEQATESCDACGARWPVIIARRDARREVIMVPTDMAEEMADYVFLHKGGKMPQSTHIYRDDGHGWVMFNLDAFLNYTFLKCITEITDGQ
jgi:hypothetical protein